MGIAVRDWRCEDEIRSGAVPLLIGWLAELGKGEQDDMGRIADLMAEVERAKQELRDERAMLQDSIVKAHARIIEITEELGETEQPEKPARRKYTRREK